MLSTKLDIKVTKDRKGLGAQGRLVATRDLTEWWDRLEGLSGQLVFLCQLGIVWLGLGFWDSLLTFSQITGFWIIWVSRA